MAAAEACPPVCLLQSPRPTELVSSQGTSPPNGWLVTNDQSRQECKGPASLLQSQDNVAELSRSQISPWDHLSFWRNHILLQLLCSVLSPVILQVFFPESSPPYAPPSKANLQLELPSWTTDSDSTLGGTVTTFSRDQTRAPLLTAETSKALRPSLGHRPQVTGLCGVAVYCVTSDTRLIQEKAESSSLRKIPAAAEGRAPRPSGTPLRAVGATSVRVRVYLCAWSE